MTLFLLFLLIKLQEICDTHQVVLEYQDQISPDPLDPLHELLEELGSAPTVASLLGLGMDILYWNIFNLYVTMGQSDMNEFVSLFFSFLETLKINFLHNKLHNNKLLRI